MEVIEKLLSVNEYSRPGRKLREKRAVILHWVGVGGQRAETVWRFFENVWKDKHYSSAHYCVDLDGRVYRFVPDDEVAYHCGSGQLDPKSGKIYTDWAREVLGAAALHPERDSPNNVTLGIEMCAVDDNGALGLDTVAAAAELTAELCRRYDMPVDRVGTHYLVVGWKDCPRVWTRFPEQFEEFRRRVEELI